jgi:hypothetical protein
MKVMLYFKSRDARVQAELDDEPGLSISGVAFSNNIITIGKRGGTPVYVDRDELIAIVPGPD